MASSLRNRARSGEQFANELESIANKVHGTALIEIAKKEVTPICIGDKKVTEHGLTLTCIKVDGVRIYWTAIKNGSLIKSWIGSQAWRKLATV